MELLMQIIMMKNFMIFGVLGWCAEILWTGFCSFLMGDASLTAKTYLWMFPIYGMASVLSPLCHAMKGKNVLLRGSVYTACIFLTEFGTGSLLKKKECCPWDYSDAKSNYKGLVRFDYAPLWFLVGLLYEKILLKQTD